MHIWKSLKWKAHGVIEKYEAKSFYKSIKGLKLRTIKNTAVVERCFLIGNGPSLLIEDLEKLYSLGEICFGANRIYGLYDKTRWRPTCFVCQDDRIMQQIYGDMSYIIENSERVFLADNVMKHANSVINKENVYPFYLRIFPAKKDVIEYSDDISKGICEGQTVLYSMAQIAIYMGYKEIYLLGVDNNFVVPTQSEKSDELNYAKGLKRIDNSKLYDAKPQSIESAYRLLKNEAEKRGVQIYNATRGGKLEVFKRVSFDDF